MQFADEPSQNNDIRSSNEKEYSETTIKAESKHQKSSEKKKKHKGKLQSWASLFNLNTIKRKILHEKVEKQ